MTIAVDFVTGAQPLATLLHQLMPVGLRKSSPERFIISEYVEGSSNIKPRIV